MQGCVRLQGALLSRLMLGAGRRGNSERSAWGARPPFSSLGRSSVSMGANPLDRWHGVHGLAVQCLLMLPCSSWIAKTGSG